MEQTKTKMERVVVSKILSSQIWYRSERNIVLRYTKLDFSSSDGPMIHLDGLIIVNNSFTMNEWLMQIKST